ncbi:hypothetical protein ABIE44_003210 [Marmoricola sp. OAE513]|uniref:HAD family acid phosphatase n=1 Tax=Marmoricola sp. OAE513 TaxID=2817894 RepID=UPI001AE20092
MRWSTTLTLGLMATLLLPVPAATAAHQLPSRERWHADVRDVMHGSRAYLVGRARTAASSERLAVNLDIDNSSLATGYSPGRAMKPVLRFTRTAHAQGIAIFFNTGRTAEAEAATLHQLRRAGYHVDRLCLRRSGESLVEGKQRCRAEFVAAGYTIVANVGNRRTDFVGGDYERRFKLPSYGNRLS